MTKHTAKAGELPNGSIDFDKVQANAKAGKDDIFSGAVTHQRNEKPLTPKQEEAAAEAFAAARPTLAGDATE